MLIGRELAALGYTIVLGNTRGHDIATTLWKADDDSPMAGGGGSGWERMEDAPRDLAAWVDLAATRESGVVLLAGHSKGAQKVILYAAEQPAARLGGVALISPDLHGMRIPGELEAARALIADGRGMETLPAQPWAPWYRQSAQTVVSHAEAVDRLLAGENGRGAIASVGVPLLATFGGTSGARRPTLRRSVTRQPRRLTWRRRSSRRRITFTVATKRRWRWLSRSGQMRSSQRIIHVSQIGRAQNHVICSPMYVLLCAFTRCLTRAMKHFLGSLRITLESRLLFLALLISGVVWGLVSPRSCVCLKL